MKTEMKLGWLMCSPELNVAVLKMSSCLTITCSATADDKAWLAITGAGAAGCAAEARQMAAGSGEAAMQLLQQRPAEQEPDGRHAEGPGLHVQPAA